MQANLKVSKNGSTGQLFIGVGSDHSWSAAGPIDWLPASRGTWYRGRNSTKFQSFNYIRLQAERGYDIVRLQDQPWKPLDVFNGYLEVHVLGFVTDGEKFEVTVTGNLPVTRKFTLRETSDLPVSYGAPIGIAAGRTGFEISDPETGKSAHYVFIGTGLSIGLPIKQLPSLSPAFSTPGPPNEFDAPSWMTVDDFDGDAIMQGASLGLGSSVSVNLLQFAGHIDGRVGYLCEVKLATGRTYGLPSIANVSGRMEKVGNAPSSKIRIRPR